MKEKILREAFEAGYMLAKKGCGKNFKLIQEARTPSVQDFTDTESAEKFKTAAKEHKIDWDAFHKAYDDALAKAGLDTAIFGSDGTFADTDWEKNWKYIDELDKNLASVRALMWLHNLYYNFIPQDKQRAEASVLRAQEAQKKLEWGEKRDAETLNTFNAVVRNVADKVYSDRRIVPFVKSGHLAPAEFLSDPKKNDMFFKPDTLVIKYLFSDSKAGEFKDGMDYKVKLVPQTCMRQANIDSHKTYMDPDIRERRKFSAELRAGRNDTCPIFNFYVDNKNPAVEDCAETIVGYLLEVLNATEDEVIGYWDRESQKVRDFYRNGVTGT